MSSPVRQRAGLRRRTAQQDDAKAADTRSSRRTTQRRKDGPQAQPGVAPRAETDGADAKGQGNVSQPQRTSRRQRGQEADQHAVHAAPDDMVRAAEGEAAADAALARAAQEAAAAEPARKRRGKHAAPGAASADGGTNTAQGRAQSGPGRHPEAAQAPPGHQEGAAAADGPIRGGGGAGGQPFDSFACKGKAVVHRAQAAEEGEEGGASGQGEDAGAPRPKRARGPPKRLGPGAAPAKPGPTRDMEAQLQASGYSAVGGADEAGRGPLAGPVVAAVVVLPPRSDASWAPPRGLNDSKAMSEQEREAVYEALTTDPRVKWAVSVVDHTEIDRINILQAALGAMRQSAVQLLREHGAAAANTAVKGGSGGGASAGPALDFLLVDGNRMPKDLPVPARTVVKGDATCSCIAAASCIAKVTRDRLMLALDAQYPEYGFAQHKGYGVPAHMEALRRHGPCPVHRRSFEPVKSMTGWSRKAALQAEVEAEGQAEAEAEGAGGAETGDRNVGAQEGKVDAAELGPKDPSDKACAAQEAEGGEGRVQVEPRERPGRKGRAGGKRAAADREVLAEAGAEAGAEGTVVQGQAKDRGVHPRRGARGRGRAAPSGVVGMMAAAAGARAAQQEPAVEPSGGEAPVAVRAAKRGRKRAEHQEPEPVAVPKAAEPVAEAMVAEEPKAARSRGRKRSAAAEAEAAEVAVPAAAGAAAPASRRAGRRGKAAV